MRSKLMDEAWWMRNLGMRQRPCRPQANPLLPMLSMCVRVCVCALDLYKGASE